MSDDRAGALARATWSPATYVERPAVGRAWRASTPIAKRLGCAARTALTDQYMLASGAVPPPDLARRVQADAEAAAAGGVDPSAIVESAMVAPVMAMAYETAYQRDTGESAPVRMVAGATAQAFQLLVEGRPADRVQAAVAAAAGKRVMHVVSTFAELAPTATAGGAPTIFDLYPDV